MKVTDFMRNINTLYKPMINQEQEIFYYDFLKRYSDKQLEELWQIVMEGHCRTSPPTIGELKKHSNGVTPLKVIRQEDNKPSERDILSTELGRLALKQGWASSYLVDCQRDGLPEQTDATILHYQRCKSEANDLLRQLDNENLYDKSLINLRRSMCEKEQRLADKYSYLI